MEIKDDIGAGVTKAKAQQFLLNVWYWRVAICRVLIYMTLTSIGTFLGLTEIYSDITWKETGEFTRWRIFMNCCISGGTVLIAFLDNTIQAMRQNWSNGQRGTGKPPVVGEPTGHTAFLKKEDV